LGLVATVGVMHVFDAAQPALLYLVPACLGASLATAAYRGELSKLLNYSAAKAEAKEAKDE
jgi:minor histocompatibility antigen H13